MESEDSKTSSCSESSESDTGESFMPRWIGAPITTATKGNKKRLYCGGVQAYQKGAFFIGDCVHCETPEGVPTYIARIDKLWEEVDENRKSKSKNEDDEEF